MARINLTAEQASDKLKNLTNERNALHAELNSLLTLATGELVAEWKAKGGCEKCHGWGRVVTWSTLDGPGWTEYGPCQDCTDVSKLAGHEPGSRWVGGYSAANSGLVNSDELLAAGKRFEAALANTYSGHLEALRNEIEAEEYACAVDRGKTVVVVKGRKVPLGTTGECFWIGPNRFGSGDRIGIRTEQDETFWTAASNVKVLAAA